MTRYTDHDDEITAETIDVEGDKVLEITISRSMVDLWHFEDRDFVVLHIEGEDSNPKFL